jgi:hypothetical protein
VVLVVVGVGVFFLVRGFGHGAPGCTVTAADGQTTYEVTTEQAGNAATIAGVGRKLGMPDHAVTVALATALQESKLRNLTSGDRDSAGLFQQRPSQGWGTFAEITDPVYSATAFYDKLRTEPNWTQLSVTQAAQLVQRSGAPDAYAQWEPESRALAGALTGELPAALTCHDLTPAAPTANLVDTATAELGTAALSGPHPAQEGWATANWLVAHATAFGLDRVSFAGKSWTADSGAWAADSGAGANLSLHQVPAPQH